MKTERFGSLVRVTEEAPPGFVWAASGVHELVAEARGGKDATESARRDIRERAALGVERCTDNECDWCNGR